jgi:hypothetical protein
MISLARLWCNQHRQTGNLICLFPYRTKDEPTSPALRAKKGPGNSSRAAAPLPCCGFERGVSAALMLRVRSTVQKGAGGERLAGLQRPTPKVLLHDRPQLAATAGQSPQRAMAAQEVRLMIRPPQGRACRAWGLLKIRPLHQRRKLNSARQRDLL